MRKSVKAIVEDFVTLAIDEYPIDQLALLVTWMNQAEDKCVYFANWCDLGDKTAALLDEYEIDLDELIDDLMHEKMRRMNEEAQEDIDRYNDLNGLH